MSVWDAPQGAELGGVRRIRALGDATLMNVAQRWKSETAVPMLLIGDVGEHREAAGEPGSRAGEAIVEQCRRHSVVTAIEPQPPVDAIGEIASHLDAQCELALPK